VSAAKESALSARTMGVICQSLLQTMLTNASVEDFHVSKDELAAFVVECPDRTRFEVKVERQAP
jgi:hypothetical protein